MCKEENTSFVQIESKDKKLKRILSRIEKLCHLQMWTSKSINLYEKYLETLDEIDKEKSPDLKGIMIEKAEAYAISSNSFFLRCFLNQSSYYLDIKRVTQDTKLRKCYRDLMELRNDEFVHWKGFASELMVTYSFNPITDKQYTIAEKLYISFKQKIGLTTDGSTILELYNTTSKFIEDQRNSSLVKVQELLGEEDIFLKSKILNLEGESIIKKDDGSYLYLIMN